MKIEPLNRWLILAANLGVLAGIILLVFELNQNRAMMRAQIRNEVAVQLIDLMSQVAIDPEPSLPTYVRHGARKELE